MFNNKNNIVQKTTLRKYISKLLNEEFNANCCRKSQIFFKESFNPHKYNTFSQLTETDLREIAKWGLEGEFAFSGAWDDADDLDEAIQYMLDDFNSMLRTEFPEGLKNFPKNPKLYRMLVLEKPEDLNTENLGYSWFADSKKINDPDFKQQMWHLRTPNLYVVSAIIPESNIDIPRTMWQRSCVWLENEVVVKNDVNIKITSVNKVK